MAILYDSFLLAAVLFIAAAFAIALNRGPIESSHPWHHAFLTYLLLIAFGFFGWFWSHGGQTLGMKTWKLKLVGDDGGQVSWKQSLIRYGVAALSWCCGGLGFLWSLLDPEKRTWHDIASHTRIVDMR